MGFLHHAKIQKKLMIQFQENARTDRRTERPYFIGPFRLPPGVQYKEECFQMFPQDIMAWEKVGKHSFIGYESQFF